MKKRLIIFQILVLSVIALLTLPTCVDPVMGSDYFEPDPVMVRNWPDLRTIEEFGLQGLKRPEGASSISYEKSFDSKWMTISFSMNSSEWGNVVNYFDQKWTRNPGAGGANEFFRGFSYVQLQATSSRYQLLVSKDAYPAVMPTVSRLSEFRLLDFAIPNHHRYGKTSISHDFEMALNPEGNMSLALSIWIYGPGNEELAISDDQLMSDNIAHYLKSYLSEPGNLGSYLYESSPRAGVYDYVGEGFISATLDIRNAPYFYEVTIFKDLRGQIFPYWPIDLLRQAGLYYMLFEPVGIKDVTFEQINNPGEDPQLIIRFYGDRDGSTERAFLD